MADLRSAKVVGVANQGRAVSLIYMDDGSQVPNVQVMSGAASSKAGRSLLHKPTPPKTPGDPTKTNDQDVYALVGTLMGGIPIVLGFYFPQVSQMMFDRDNFLIDRHPSDVYHTIDDDGNVTVRHPSGTSIVISTDPEAEDLTGQDFDKKFAIARNADKAVHVRVKVMNAGVQKADLHLDPDGNLILDLAGDATVTVAGDLHATVAGDAEVAVTGDLTSSADSWTHTGDVTVDGEFHATGAVTLDDTLDVSGKTTVAEIDATEIKKSGVVVAAP